MHLLFTNLSHGLVSPHNQPRLNIYSSVLYTKAGWLEKLQKIPEYVSGWADHLRAHVAGSFPFQGGVTGLFQVMPGLLSDLQCCIFFLQELDKLLQSFAQDS